MSISSVQAGQQTGRTSYSGGGTVRNKEQSLARDRSPDTVVISEKARELSNNLTLGSIREKNGYQQSNAGLSGKDLPVEAYALPGWMGDLIPDHVKLDTQIGQSWLESNSALYNRLGSREKADLSEYMDTLMESYREESERRGIETAEAYYHAIVLGGSPDLGEDIQQAVKKRLVSDSRTMELMRQFGVFL